MQPSLIEHHERAQVLTVQCNLTVDCVHRTGKAVIIVRDPVAQVEIGRWGTRDLKWETLICEFGDAWQDAVQLLETLEPRLGE
jgi:hypothetical protein